MADGYCSSINNDVFLAEIKHKLLAHDPLRGRRTDEAEHAGLTVARVGSVRAAVAAEYDPLVPVCHTGELGPFLTAVVDGLVDPLPRGLGVEDAPAELERSPGVVFRDAKVPPLSFGLDDQTAEVVNGEAIVDPALTCLVLKVDLSHRPAKDVCEDRVDEQ